MLERLEVVLSIIIIIIIKNIYKAPIEQISHKAPSKISTTVYDLGWYVKVNPY